MLKMIPVPNIWLFQLLLLASFFFGIPASEAAFLKNMPSGAKNYFLTDLSPDKSPKHQDSCRVPRQNPRDSSLVLTVFIQEDPLRDGYHWYGYVNDPVNRSDPSGFFGFPDTFNYAKGAPDYETQQRMFAESGNALAVLMAQIAVGFTPVVGDLYDASVAASGYDVIAREHVSPFERTVAGSCATIGGSFGLYQAAKKYRGGSEIVANNVDAVIEETLKANRRQITSQYILTADEALDAGQKFLGTNYSEIGGNGSGVFRSTDGTRQFRIDDGSLSGNHDPHIPHIHLETFSPGAKHPTVNNHIPFLE